MIAVAAPYKVFAFWFALLCLVLTALLLIWPNVFRAANRLSKKWFATDVVEQELNRTHDIDEKLLDLRKILGGILLLLAVFFVILLFR